MIADQIKTIRLNPIHGSKGIETEVETNLRVVEGGVTKPDGHGLFRILNQKDGDKRVVWDKDKLSEINEAERTFQSLIEQGFTPHRVDPSEKVKPEVMTKFDPSAEEVIFVPMMALVGG